MSLSGVFTIGLISDTHGLLRPEALVELQGSDCIIHAGDVGDPRILAELSRIAPVTVVRGNIDVQEWASAWPDTAQLEPNGMLIHVIHDLAGFTRDAAGPGLRAVVSGHSHRPGIREQDGILFVNPGSAGRRRFSLPISMARLHVTQTGINAELVMLDIKR